MKQRNPRFGCPRIAQQINKAFGVDIDKDVVRRILATYYRPGSGDSGPSWLSFLGHSKDSLWSIDLFRCESIHLKSHSVLVVMDNHSRRIKGFGVHVRDSPHTRPILRLRRPWSGVGIQNPPVDLLESSDMQKTRNIDAKQGTGGRIHKCFQIRMTSDQQPCPLVELVSAFDDF